jgi:hypothetical protein
MRAKLITALKRRFIELDRHTEYLREVDPGLMLDITTSVLFLYTRSSKNKQKATAFLSEIISASGHALRSRLRLPRNSALAAKTGAFILYTYEQLGIVQVRLGAGKKHGTYLLEVLDDAVLESLWEKLTAEKTEKFPSETPYAEWTQSRHITGVNLVKTNDKYVLNMLTPETHPIVFNVVNKAQRVGWNVNADIYHTYVWALKNKTDAFAEIWELQNPEAKATKLREAKTIGNIAARFIRKTFYHMYTLDFRGRKYASTAYFHEQGTDLAKGLLLRADSKPIGERGFWWLMVSIASNWGGDSGRLDGVKTDKIPLNERYHWSLLNERLLLSYAEHPRENQGWMKADKPWQFLAACNEFLKLRKWQKMQGFFSKSECRDDYRYESQLECYIDGSNNGSQHLSALTRDEITAPHVNLVPLPLPGDLYKYVAEHVWDTLEEEGSQLSEEERGESETFIDELIDLKLKINRSIHGSEERKRHVNEIVHFKESNRALMDISAPIFWLRIQSMKEKRKIAKRNVMTLPYGGTAYGLGCLLAQYKLL